MKKPKPIDNIKRFQAYGAKIAMERDERSGWWWIVTINKENWQRGFANSIKEARQLAIEFIKDAHNDEQ